MDDATVVAGGFAAANLVVRQGAMQGKSFPLGRQPIVLGREESADIVLPDPEMSRRHARISWQEGRYVLEDLRSTNGTSVNGVVIRAPQMLNPGDRIGVGQTVLEFEWSPPPSLQQPVPPPPAYAAPPPAPPAYAAPPPPPSPAYAAPPPPAPPAYAAPPPPPSPAYAAPPPPPPPPPPVATAPPSAPPPPPVVTASAPAGRVSAPRPTPVSASSVAPAQESKSGKSRCLLYGCGCLIVLFLVVVVALAATMYLVPEQLRPLQDLLDQYKIPLQLIGMGHFNHVIG